MNMYGSEIFDSYMLEILSSSVWKYWEKSELNLITDFALTRWVLCAVPHLHEYASDDLNGGHSKQINNFIKMFFM